MQKPIDRLWRRLAALAVLTVALPALLCGCNGADPNDDGGGVKPVKPARNVILLIGDGMGVGQVTLGRLAGPGVHEGLGLEKTPYVGLVKTYSTGALVTDSAAAATAFSTGRKTVNGTIGMSPDGNDVENLAEWCRKNGKSVGLVTTTTVTHATPACFAVHCSERKRESEIAELFLGSGVEVLMGGGLRYFPDALQKQFRDRGYTFALNRQEMMGTREPHLIGLFSPSHMDFEIDRDPAVQPSLEEMALKALKVLDEDKDGFFLMIEGGRIDHACHAHDAGTLVRDVAAFDLAVRAAVAFAEREGNTLVLVTADHACGGLAITEKVNIERLRAQKASAEKMGRLVNDGKQDLSAVLREWSGIDPDEETVKQIRGLEDIGTAPYGLQNAIAHVLSEQAGIGWHPLHIQATHLVTKGHDGADVALYAWGPRAGDFTGVLENTEVGVRIRRAMEKPR